MPVEVGRPSGDEPIVTDGPLDAEGRFEMSLGTVIVTGETNPVSRLRDEANLTIQGRLRKDFICGDVVGRLIRPTDFDLADDPKLSAAVQPVCAENYGDLSPALSCLSCDAISRTGVWR